MGAFKGTEHRLAIRVYLALTIVMYAILLTKTLAVPSVIVYTWFQFISIYAYNRTNVCPLEIITRVRPTQYNKVFRRMYKKRYTEMAFLYFGFAFVAIGTIIFKLIIWIR